MTKQEQLIEYNIQDTIEYIAQDFGIEYDQAMQLFTVRRLLTNVWI